MKTTPSRLSKVKNLQKPLIVLFLNVILTPSKCDDVGFFSSEEDDLEIVCVKFDGSYPMERIEEDLL